MAKTYKDLQDECLEWMADANDTGLMLTLVKQALDKAQRQLLTSEQLDFMMSPVTSLTVVSGQTTYALPSDCLSLLYLYDPDRREFLEDVPAKSTLESLDELVTASEGVFRFRLTSVDGVSTQPATPSTVTVDTTGGSEAAANYVIVQGLTSAGLWVSESLQTGSTWTSRTTTNTFARVDNLIKVGASWTRTITVTAGSTTLASFTYDQYVAQYPKLELIETPTASDTLEYRYYRAPIDLVYDYQLPQVPDAYRDVLVYKTLLSMVGFTKATPEERRFWGDEVERLTLALKQNYQQGRSLGARARRIRMIPRT